MDNTRPNNKKFRSLEDTTRAADIESDGYEFNSANMDEVDADGAKTPDCRLGVKVIDMIAASGMQ